MACYRAVLLLGVVLVCSGCFLRALAPTEPLSADSSSGTPVKPEFLPVYDRPVQASGEKDVDNRYGAVVMVKTLKGDGEQKRCSGVLIGPRLVLTAGRCVCQGPRVGPAGDGSEGLVDSSTCVQRVTVTTAAYEQPEGVENPEDSQLKSYNGRVRAPPALKTPMEGAHGAAGDAELAVILLDKAVESRFSPAALADAEVQLHEPIVLVGYGNGAESSASSVRRFTRGRVAEVAGPGRAEFLIERPGEEEFRAGSGSACFREDERGIRLVGIVSDGGGRGPTVTGTHLHRDWLRAELASSQAPHHGEP